MPLSTQQYREYTGRHNNYLQTQALVPVHLKNHAGNRARPLLGNITRVTRGADPEYLERQGARSSRKSVAKCSTGKVIFTVLSCCAMATAAGLIIHDLLNEKAMDNPRLIKTDHFAQGKMNYFTDKRVEYTPHKGYPGYLAAHEKLSFKYARRNRK